MAIETGLIPKELVKFLNYRVNQEEASERLYYAMHEWLDNKGYFGAAKMIGRWANEESEHAMWTRDFLESYGYLPEVNKIEKPNISFSSLKEAFKKAYEHEIEITEQCNELVKKVMELDAFYAMPLAMKYMKEQEDELGKVTKWLDRLSLVGDDARETMMIDREMGGGSSDGCCDSPMAKSSY